MYIENHFLTLMHARWSGVSPLMFFLLTLANCAAFADCGVRPAGGAAAGGATLRAPAVFLGEVFVGVVGV